MLDVFWPLTRPILFAMDAEVAHERTLAMLEVAPRLLSGLASLTMGSPPPALARKAFGLDLAGPIGLAAGLDKDGRAIEFWPSLGFGFLEVGTVTAHPQPGNDRPRLFRLVDDGALLNRMGFNNHGSEALAVRLRHLRERGRWPKVPVGANVGKSKVTPLEEAPADYALSVRRLAGLADWFTVNVSSPNTPGLRSLQDPAQLSALLGAVQEAAKGTPVLLKLAPDLDADALGGAVEIAVQSGLAGIVATNTTLSRQGLRQDPHEAGGLSGRPLWPIARAAIGHVLAASHGRLPVIGCGGISTADQVRELLTAGCAAVQLYSALILDGPGLPARLNKRL